MAEELPDGWAAGWSAEHSRFYYFNAALAITQWHAPYSTTALNVDALGVKALKELVTSAGLSIEGCLDKADLRARAREAIAKLAVSTDAAQPACTDVPRPACTDVAGSAITDAAGSAAGTDVGPLQLSARAEAAVASALGFVDPIVHAAATHVLLEQSSMPDAVAQLRRHLADADAVACAEALFGGGVRGGSSSEEDDEEEGDGDDTSARGDVHRVAPWEAWASDGRVPDPPALPGARADLHAELLAFAEWVVPRKCELRARSAIKRLVARELQALGAGVSVDAYGSGATGMALYSSDVDLHFAPPASLKTVASLLSDARDSGGRRAFRDADVLQSARVPIVAVCHAATRIEVDVSCATGEQDTSTPRLVAEATARHAAMRPLALFVKVLLMQRGLHETYTGGLSSFKLYILLGAWLSTSPPRASPPRASSCDHGAALLGFLRAHATRLGSETVACRGVEADLSRVRLHEVMAAFGEAASGLARHGRLAAVVDARALHRSRERSVARAEAFTAALLAERDAGGGAGSGAGGGAVGHADVAATNELGKRAAPHAAPAYARQPPPLGGEGLVEGRPKRPRARAVDAANPGADGAKRRGSLFDLVQFQ